MDRGKNRIEVTKGNDDYKEQESKDYSNHNGSPSSFINSYARYLRTNEQKYICK